MAVNGKAVRRSHDGGNEAAIHMGSAWAAENNLVLAQVQTEEESNEIASTPRLLQALALTVCLITIDAMGRQKSIEGGYLLAVKNDQPKLEDAIKATLSHRKAEIDLKGASKN